MNHSVTPGNLTLKKKKKEKKSKKEQSHLERAFADIRVNILRLIKGASANGGAREKKKIGKIITLASIASTRIK